MLDHGAFIRICVPARVDFLPVLMDVASRASAMAGFDDGGIHCIQLAVEEAATNAIAHGYAPGESGELEVEFRRSPLGLEVAVRDQGRPFDPALLPRFDPGALLRDADQKGLGTFLMGRVVDELSFHHRGRQGMEVRLLKYLPAARAGEGSDPSATATAPVAEDPGTFTIRPFRDEDAEAVSQLAWEAYRYTYLNEQIYYPERVREMNRSGKLRSWLAVTARGEIFGHAGRIPTGLDDGVAELAVAFVSPRYRGGGALNRITAALVEEARAVGLKGLFAQAVTTHPYSQKTMHKFGLGDTCLLLGGTSGMDFKAIREGAPPRETLLNGFLGLMDPGPTRIFPPPWHRKMIERIYNGLGRTCVVGEPGLPSRTEQTRCAVHPTAYGTANVQVLEAGPDAPTAVHAMVRHLCREQYEVIFVHMELADPAAMGCVAALETFGLFFAGIRPGSPGRDLLVLQYLNTYTADYERMRFDSDLARELAAYVRARDPAGRTSDLDKFTVT